MRAAGQPATGECPRLDGHLVSWQGFCSRTKEVPMLSLGLTRKSLSSCSPSPQKQTTTSGLRRLVALELKETPFFTRFARVHQKNSRGILLPPGSLDDSYGKIVSRGMRDPSADSALVCRRNACMPFSFFHQRLGFSQAREIYTQTERLEYDARSSG